MKITKTFNLTTAIFAVISFFQLEGVHGNIEVDEVDGNSATADFKGTIGVSIYFPQVGINTMLETYALGTIGCGDMTDFHAFGHMGVYYLPGAIDSDTEDYLVGLPGTPSIPMTQIPKNLDATCDNTNSCCGLGPGAQTPYPFFRDAYDEKENKYANLEQVGFEITYSNGESFTDFSTYDQTLALGIPGHYIRKDSDSAYIWTPEAAVTIWVPTDMAPSDFMLAAEHVARQMNKEGGYSPQRTCQHFSLNLLALLKAPEDMIREVKRFHVTGDDVACLGTLCGFASIIPKYGFEMCGNMGICLPELGCLKHVNMPMSCIEENPAYQDINTSPSWGDWNMKTNTNECWGDGVLCISGGTCGNCCDSYHLGPIGVETYCGPQTSCWGKDTLCVPGISCGKCCNSWSMYLTGPYCD